MPIVLKDAKMRLHYLILAGIILLGLGVRVYGLGWDHLAHYHPDERYITWVGTTIEFSGHDSWSAAFHPRQSRFNPYYWPAGQTTAGIVVPVDQTRNFAYGHFPLYLGVGFSRLLDLLGFEFSRFSGWIVPAEAAEPLDLSLEFNRLTAAGRLLTAIFDTGSIVLLYFIGRRLFSPAAGLIAAGLLACTVLHIQLAHFFIADSYLTFFSLLALDQMIRAVSAGTIRTQKMALGWSAVAAGWAIGSKFSAVVLGLPLGLTLLLLFKKKAWRPALWVGGLTFLSFLVTNPFAVIDFSCPAETAQIAGRSLSVTHCYVQNIARESAMVRGGSAFPFTRQYEGTLPIVYPLQNQLNWGMGWPLGIVGFGGLFVFLINQVVAGWPLRRTSQNLIKNGRSTFWGGWILISWVVPFLLLTGTFQVKFMRYWQPVVPLVILTGVWLLWHRLPGGKWQPWWLALVLTIAYSIVYTLFFLGIYRQPHPWREASIWFYQHAPAGSVIAVELWDETLPTQLSRVHPEWDRRRFELVELNWLSRAYERDDQAKLEANIAVLAAADYWIVASNRSYGVISRLPEVYPLSSQVYRNLFNDQLGFRPVFVVDRPLAFAGTSISADRFATAGLQPPAMAAAYLAQSGRWIGPAVDESFTVYDQPLTIIFENQGRLSPAELERILTGD